VSSFGFGGTNVHVVLEEAPRVELDAQRAAAQGTLLLPISARSAEALSELAGNFHDLLADSSAGHEADVCAAAALRRDHHPHRLAVLARSREGLRAALKRHLGGEPSAAVRANACRGTPSVLLLFGDHGERWPAAAATLLEHQAFRASLEATSGALRPSGAPLTALLTDGPPTHGAANHLPALSFAVQVAFTALLRGAGVEPAVTLGVGTGALAASVVSGASSMDDARRALSSRSTGASVRADPGPCEVTAHLERIARGGTHPVVLVVGGHVPDSVQMKLEPFRARGRALSLPFGAEDGCGVLHEAMASLYVAGCDFDWASVVSPPRAHVRLPAYPWQRQRHWISAAAQWQDRPAVPDVGAPAEASLHARPQLPYDFVAPASEAELAIAAAFEEALGIAPVGSLDNFFDLGGDSVTALQIAMRVASTGLQLTPKHVLEHATPREIAVRTSATHPLGDAARPRDATRPGVPSPARPTPSDFPGARLDAAELQDVLMEFEVR
jgi:acyl transferase domain-containing protein